MNELATQSEDGKIKQLIESDRFKSAVASALPAHLKPERFIRVALTALTRTPKLAQCDQASFFQCLLTLSQFGLEPDGRNAHLIPFENRKRNVTECQLIVDYKGLVDLAMRSGKLAYIHADKVCENDVFEYDRGEIKAHKINFQLPRGKAYAYYALVRFKDGTEKPEVMPKEDIDAIRARSRAKDSGPWVTDYDEMAKKTVFRRLSKWLQLSPEYRDALEADADKLEEHRFDAALPVIGRPVIGALPGTVVAPVNDGDKPEKKPRGRPSRKPEVPVTDPPETTVVTSPTAKEIEKKLSAAGYSVADLIAVAIRLKWLDPLEEGIEASLAAIGEDKLEAIREEFPMILEMIAKAKKEPADALFSDSK
jgi:recombination protein RecT